MNVPELRTYRMGKFVHAGCIHTGFYFRSISCLTKWTKRFISSTKKKLKEL